MAKKSALDRMTETELLARLDELEAAKNAEIERIREEAKAAKAKAAEKAKTQKDAVRKKLREAERARHAAERKADNHIKYALAGVLMDYAGIEAEQVDLEGLKKYAQKYAKAIRKAAGKNERLDVIASAERVDTWLAKDRELRTARPAELEAYEDDYGYPGLTVMCPACGDVIEEDSLKSLEVPDDEVKVVECSSCGQLVSWRQAEMDAAAESYYEDGDDDED